MILSDYLTSLEGPVSYVTVLVLDSEGEVVGTDIVKEGHPALDEEMCVWDLEDDHYWETDNWSGHIIPLAWKIC
jgi:hypothetical protein